MTDIDGFLEHYAVYADWIAPAGVMPPQSLIGVSRLVMPDLLVEIEVQAAALKGDWNRSRSTRPGRVRWTSASCRVRRVERS